MMNQAKFPDLPFLSAKASASELYAVQMDEDTFVELGWYAYRDIGNVAVDNYIVILPVDGRGYVDLPDNLETIDAVTTTEIPLETLGNGYAIYDSGIPIKRWFATQSTINETARFFDLSQHDSITPGELVGYDWVERYKIKIANAHLYGGEIYISYKGIIVDNMCLPMVTFKESQAIAARVAFMKVQRDLMMGKKGAGEIIQFIQPTSERLMQAAKIPEYINQNEWDDILNAQTTWDRKKYGRTFKPYSGR